MSLVSRLVCLSIFLLFSLSVKAEIKMKVALIGRPGAGKTSLIHKLVYDRFEYVIPKKIKTNIYNYKTTLNLKNFNIDLIDHSETGHLFDMITPILNADALIFVLDVNNPIIIQDLLYWKCLIHLFSNNNKPLVIMANKIDIKESNVSWRKQAAIYANVIKCKYFEASAKNNSDLLKVLNYFASLPLIDHLHNINNDLDMNMEKIISKRIDNKHPLFVKYFFRDKISHQNFLNRIKEEEISEYVNFCTSFLYDLKKRKNEVDSREKYKYFTFVMSLSANLSFLSQDIYTLLYDNMTHLDFDYLVNILRRWHIEIETTYNFMNTKLDVYLEYIEMENDFQLLASIVLQMAGNGSMAQDLNETTEFLMKLLKTAKTRVINQLKYSSTGHKVLMDILDNAKNIKSPFNKYTGRYSIITEIVESYVN